MKAYVNKNNLVIGIDGIFTDCEPIEITKKQKSFIEACKLPKYDGNIFFEGLTEYDITQQKLQQAISIDLEYTQKITELLAKPIEKIMCKEYDSIPLDKLAERDLLRTECNEKILALGITDFTYRKTIKGL